LASKFLIDELLYRLLDKGLVNSLVVIAAAYAVELKPAMNLFVIVDEV